MLRSSESETEILLGNKQLLGIFFLVAVLLGIAFTSGYMIGRGAGPKKGAAAPVADASAPSSAPDAAGGETHAVTPADSGQNSASQAGNSTPADAGAEPSDQAAAPDRPAETPLGAKHKRPEPAKEAQEETPDNNPEPAPAGFAPQSGQEFLQVAAVARGDANSIADVLRKKGFRAHAVPAPSNPNLYRVIVGPVRDAGDLSATRDALRKTGFRDVIVQHYK